ncbi:hypothetical protein QBC34DRAFT_419472, partial [Podospora aff. communis PSN243]
MTDPAESSRALILHRHAEDLSQALVVRGPRGDSSAAMSDVAAVSESVTSDIASPQPAPGGSSKRQSSTWKGKRPAKSGFSGGAVGSGAAPNGQRNGGAQRQSYQSRETQNTSGARRNQPVDNRGSNRFPSVAEQHEGSESSDVRQHPPRHQRQDYVYTEPRTNPAQQPGDDGRAPTRQQGSGRPLEERLNRKTPYREPVQADPGPSAYFPPGNFYSSYPGLQHPQAPMTIPPQTAPPQAPLQRTAEAQKIAEKAMELALLGKLKDELKSVEASIVARHEKLEMALELHASQLKESDAERQAQRAKEMEELVRRMDQKFEILLKEKLGPIYELRGDLESAKKDLDFQTKLRQGQDLKLEELTRKLEHLEAVLKEKSDRDAGLRTKQAMEAISAAKRELESELDITRKFMEGERKELRAMVTEACEMEERVRKAMEDAKSRADASKMSYEDDVRTLEEIRQLTKNMTATARGVEDVADQAFKGVGEAKKMLAEIHKATEAAKEEAEGAKEEAEKSRKTVAEVKGTLQHIERDARSFHETAAEVKRVAEESKDGMYEIERVLRETRRFADLAQRSAEEATLATEQAKITTDNANIAAEQAKRSSEEAMKTATEARRMANEAAGYKGPSGGPTPLRPGVPMHPGWTPPEELPPGFGPLFTGPAAGAAKGFSQFQIPPSHRAHSFHSAQGGSQHDMEASSTTGSSLGDSTSTTQSEDPEAKREIRMFKQVLYDAFFDVMSDTRPWFRNEDAMGMGMAGLGVQPAPWQSSQPLDRSWQHGRRQGRSSVPLEAVSADESESTWQRSRKHGKKKSAVKQGGLFATGGRPRFKRKASGKSGRSDGTVTNGVDGPKKARKRRHTTAAVASDSDGDDPPRQTSTESALDHGYSDDEHSQTSFHSALSGEESSEDDGSDQGLGDHRHQESAYTGSTSSRRSLSSLVSRNSVHKGRKHHPLMVEGESSSRAMRALSPSTGTNRATPARTPRHGRGQAQGSMAGVDAMPTPFIQQVFVGPSRGAEPPKPVRRRVYATSETEESEGSV